MTAPITAAELLLALGACLCAELTPEGEEGPGLCFCGLIPGEIADASMAGLDSSCADEGCGMAWVRLEAAYPSQSAGQYQAQPNQCGEYLGLDIELGVLRCIDCGEDGNSPSAQAMEDAAKQALDDMQAVRRAVKCCEALKDLDYLLGTWAPAGPQGCVAGGVWTVSVNI